MDFRHQAPPVNLNPESALPPPPPLQVPGIQTEPLAPTLNEFQAIPPAPAPSLVPIVVKGKSTALRWLWWVLGGIILAGAIGGGYFAYNQGSLHLPFLSNTNTVQANTNTLTVTTNTQTNTTSAGNTNETRPSPEFAANTENMGYASCYVFAHPDVLQEMPQNAISETYREYVTADPSSLDCLSLDQTVLTTSKPLLVTDADRDGLTLISEQFFGTSDTAADSDNDGINDLEEVLTLNQAMSNTNSDTSLDSDSDGLTDEQETDTYQTDPQKADTDGDSYPDKTEIENQYNPLGGGKATAEQLQRWELFRSGI